jgi:hypothetical protein
MVMELADFAIGNTISMTKCLGGLRMINASWFGEQIGWKTT